MYSPHRRARCGVGRRRVGLATTAGRPRCAAAHDGRPCTSQDAGVLQSADDDALGRWADRGRIYTGDSVGTGTGDRWSIDMTVGRIAGRDYAVWSGWAQRATTDKTPQQLYIAPLANPWTFT